MPWPEPASFASMLQNPKVAFKDSALQKARIARDANNQLLGLSGQFAVVWPATLPDGRKIAVRTFSSDRPGRREHYRAVSDYLSGRSLNSLVPFKYQEKAVRASDGKLYPAIIMDWVDGSRLDQWLQAKCREGNRKELAAAAEKWPELVNALEDAKICHGGLSPDNILVTASNGFKLVDYDCLGVPPLFGVANPETGTLPYQHPSRSPTTPLSPSLHNFSAIYVYVVLRALAAAPQLWEEHAEQGRYEGLLFQSADFQSPATSQLYRSLMNLPDRHVVESAKVFFDLYRGPLDDVPALREYRRRSEGSSSLRVESPQRQPGPLAAGAVLVLVEESSAMCGLLAPSGRLKSAVVEDAVKELVRAAFKRPPVDLAVIGYRSNSEGQTDVACRWNGRWEGRTFVSSAEFSAMRASGPCQLSATGFAPQVAAFEFCRDLLESQAGSLAPDANPPLVVHISAGVSQDGNPAKAIRRLQQMVLPCGRPIVLQVHLAGRASALESIRFPSAVKANQPPAVRDLFERASELPNALAGVLQNQGVPVAAGARAMIYNAREGDLKQLLHAVRSLA